MNLRINPSKLSGTIVVPGSKSHTIRAVAMAMMAEGTSSINAPLISEDTLSAIRAAEAFGMKINRGDDSVWTAEGLAGKLQEPDGVIDMANSGTSIKIFAALAAQHNIKASFDGDESLRSRPMKSLLDALDQCGVETSSDNGKCPFTVKGPFKEHKNVTVNGKSSQYVSAMLFASAFSSCGETINVINVNEQPYIGLTLSWMKRLGLQFEAAEDYTHFEVPGGQKTKGFTYTIPADFSTAAFPLAAAAVTKSEIGILNLDFMDVQGDKGVFLLLSQMGADIRKVSGKTIVKGGKLNGMEIDLNAMPDALPALSVVAAFAEGTTKLYNVANARIKETDRIACMTRELQKMGIKITELPDGMIIEGGKPKGAVLESYGDHRIAMALAVAGLAAEGETIIRGAECAAVTYPAFFKAFKALGADFTLEN